jgi:hypothetical protein
MTVPDYSPKMLRLFLHARVRFAGAEAALFEPSNRISGERAEKRRLRKAARVTNVEFEMAWMGRLLSPGDRTRLWAALGVFPADFGVVLEELGRQTPAAEDVAEERTGASAVGRAA